MCSDRRDPGKRRKAGNELRKLSSDRKFGRAQHSAFFSSFPRFCVVRFVLPESLLRAIVLSASEQQRAAVKMDSKRRKLDRTNDFDTPYVAAPSTSRTAAKAAAIAASVRAAAVEALKINGPNAGGGREGSHVPLVSRSPPSFPAQWKTA